MGIYPGSMNTSHRRHIGTRRMVSRLLLGVSVLCPLGANAAMARGVEALTKGESYAVPAVAYCTNADALHALVDIRHSGDLDTLPSGCFRPGAAKFSAEFKGFIPDHKVSDITVPEKLITPNRYGRSTCTDPDTEVAVKWDSQPKIPHWFALDPDRTPFAFAGIWRPWTGTRGTKGAPEDGEHLLFSFLTTEPNEVVRPVHSKAMPVILMGAACDVWLEADAAEALKLQQPWPADRLSVVARGQRQDAGPAPAEGALL